VCQADEKRPTYQNIISEIRRRVLPLHILYAPSLDRAKPGTRFPGTEREGPRNQRSSEVVSKERWDSIGSIRDRLPQVSRTVPLLHHFSASQPPSLPLDDKSYARHVSRSRRYHVEEPAVTPLQAAMAPIDLAHDSISCMSLPLYLRNLFADRDRPGIGVLTDPGVFPIIAREEVRCPLSSTLILSPSKPADPTRTTYLGSELLGSSTLCESIGGVNGVYSFLRCLAPLVHHQGPNHSFYRFQLTLQHRLKEQREVRAKKKPTARARILSLSKSFSLPTRRCTQRSLGPLYNLYATTKDGKPTTSVSLHYRVNLSQRTGEDWTNAKPIPSTSATDALNAGKPSPDNLIIRPPTPPPSPILSKQSLIVAKHSEVIEEEKEQPDEDMGFGLFNGDTPPAPTVPLPQLAQSAAAISKSPMTISYTSKR